VAPETIVPALRKVLHVTDPALPLVAVRTQQAQIDENLADERLLVSLGSIFGVLALVLASVGIYGVMALSVAQRTREIGIRMALGATAAAVVRLVMGQSARLAGIGAAIGLAIAFGVLKILSSAIHMSQVSVVDGAAFAGGVALVLAGTAFAAYHPARRATRVDPAVTLRADA
jgi:putative ABC transport system permease protein